VILAAGKGTRFEGGNKLLANVEGTPIVRRAAETLCLSSVDDIIAVVGHEADRVAVALADLDLSRSGSNENYAAGQSASVRTGVDAARDADWDATVFHARRYAVRSSTDRGLTLRTAYVTGDGSIVAPTYEGHRGNPVLFGRQHYDALSTVSGDRGGRNPIENHEKYRLRQCRRSGREERRRFPVGFGAGYRLMPFWGKRSTTQRETATQQQPVRRPEPR